MDSVCEYDFYDDCTDSGNESHELYESEDDLKFEMDLDFIEQQSDGLSQKIEEDYYYEVNSIYYIRNTSMFLLYRSFPSEVWTTNPPHSPSMKKIK